MDTKEVYEQNKFDDKITIIDSATIESNILNEREVQYMPFRYAWWLIVDFETERFAETRIHGRQKHASYIDVITLYICYFFRKVTLIS